MKLFEKIFLLYVFFTMNVTASDEVDRFAKCYQQFSGEVITPNNSILINVKNGSITGKMGCEQLLKTGNLVQGKLAEGVAKESGKKVLRTFNSLHNSFFKKLPLKTDKEKWVYDYNDRSYYLLLSMFSTRNGTSNYPFRKIFTDPETYQSIRENNGDPGYRLNSIEISSTSILEGFSPGSLCGNRNTWQACISFPFTYQTIDPRIFAKSNTDVSSGYIVSRTPSGEVRDEGKLLSIGGISFTGNHNALLLTNDWGWSLNEVADSGEIVGVVPVAPKSLPHLQQRLFNDSDGYWRNYLGPAYKQPYPNVVENIFDNLGAGILFTPNFQQKLGLDVENMANQNGVDKVPREWVQDIIKDFLCRDIPVIRQADAIQHTSAPNPRAPFRSSASCMRCHATIDNLSFIARNYQYSKTSPLSEGNVRINQFHSVTEAANQETPFNPDDFFPVRPGNGNFRYRDHSGKYHDVGLSSDASDPKRSFRQLGEYLSNMDDPYVCLTSKYFQYFTGISPVFSDPGDPDSVVLSERDKAIQSYLLTLGKDLKNNGDLQKVILDIVSSRLYVDPLADSIK